MTRKVGCACGQGINDLLKASKPETGLLKKIQFAGCGKTFWTNTDKRYCFTCEEKLAVKGTTGKP